MRLSAYLEAAKTEELVQELVQQGFAVQRDQPIGPATADILATRNGRRRAVDVVAEERLAAEFEARQALRGELREAGIDEYQLVVIPAPRGSDAELDELDLVLCGLCERDLQAEFDHLSSSTLIDEVSDVAIDRLHVRRDGIDVAGSATLWLLLRYGSSGDGYLESRKALPLRFDLELDFEHNVLETRELEVIGDE